MAPLLEKELSGFGELFRMLSFEEIGAAAVLSRALAGTAGAHDRLRHAGLAWRRLAGARAPDRPGAGARRGPAPTARHALAVAAR